MHSDLLHVGATASALHVLNLCMPETPAVFAQIDTRRMIHSVASIKQVMTVTLATHACSVPASVV